MFRRPVAAWLPTLSYKPCTKYNVDVSVDVNVSCIWIDKLSYFIMTINICFFLWCSVPAKGGSFTGALVFTGEVVEGLY